MDQKFILQPFAFAGDVADIPNDVQVDGSVSFNQGFGFDYQRELGVDPLAKPIPRDQTNYLYNVITDNLAQYQRNGVPEFITTTDNGGAAYPYDKGVAVKWRALPGDPWGVYVSMVAANTTIPSDTTKWQALLFIESTALQATTGTDGTSVMTPRRVAAAIAASTVVVPDASETVKGIAEIATTAETNTGTDNTRIITPAKLAAYVPAASTTVIGKTRLATNAEAIAGALSSVAVTPSGLAAAIAAVAIPDASETVKGIAEIATQAEVTTGTDDTRIVTPLKLATAIPAASSTVVGKSRFATTAETSALAAVSIGVTPGGLAAIMGTKANLASPTFTGTVTVPGLTSSGQTIESTTTNLVLSNGVLAGSVYLRPNGSGSATGQLIVTTTTVTWNGNTVYHTGNFDPALKADLASPALTGTPTAPTAAGGTNTTQLATTAFVFAGLALKANLASPALTGVPTAPTAAVGTNTTQLATTAFVQAYDDAAKANLASPALTGVPTAPTAAPGTNTTQLATTAFVFAGLALKANLAGPTFTGTANFATIVASGSVTATGGFQQGSSRKIKNLDGPMPYGLAELLQIETAIGSYKPEYVEDGGRKRLFVIAEQLAEIVSEPVFKDTVRATGEERVASVDFNQLVPLLIKALQEEHAARVAAESALRRAIDGLTLRVSDLEAMR